MRAIPADANSALAKRVARTYGGDRDPWKRVGEYERVQRAMAEHPDKCSGAIASVVDLPRSRIRAWVEEGSAPDPVRGLETATDHGWLTTDTEDPAFRGLNVLVAWVFSGGSIAMETFAPRFVVDDRADRDRLADAMDRVGVEVRWHHGDDPDRATETTPALDGSVLGRVLVALGAPRGDKTVVSSLPWYLDATSRPVRLDWARTYVCNRGVEREGPETALQIIEQRSVAFRDALGRLCRQLVERDGAVRVRENALYFDPTAAGVLDRAPTFDREDATPDTA